jgi:DNA-binding NarL/FixJ family response regulator
MTRVLLVDDHPAVRAGLTSVLRGEPGIVVVGAVARAAEAVAKLTITWPDVVIVDYRLPDSDGLALCQQLKAMPDPPAILVFSAFADGSLAVAAQIAGAEGLVNKAASPYELIDAVRAIRRGTMIWPLPSPAVTAEVATAIDEEDLPILGMILNGTTRAEVSDVLNLTEAEISSRIAAMVKRIMAASSKIEEIGSP